MLVNRFDWRNPFHDLVRAVGWQRLGARHSHKIVSVL
jgi:hypothetical protein